MNELQVAAVVAMLTAAAAGAAGRGLRSRRRTIAQVRATLYPPFSDVPATARRQRSASFVERFALAPVTASVERRIGVGLRLLSQSPADVGARVVLSSVAGAAAVVLSVASLSSIGVLPFSRMWLVAALGVGAACGWIMWSDVQQKILRRRRELQRATNDFVQLIALGLTTDQSVEEAIGFALGVGANDPDPHRDTRGDVTAWEILRRDLSTAPQRGVALWEALDALGTEYDQRELSELGTSIERQGTRGVSITDTVSTLAASMRAKALDALEREADRVNANLAGPTVGFVVTMIVFLAYPLALRITEAFGG